MAGLIERVRAGEFRRPLRPLVSRWFSRTSTRKVDIDETRFKYDERPEHIYHDNERELWMASYVYPNAELKFVQPQTEETPNAES